MSFLVAVFGKKPVQRASVSTSLQGKAAAAIKMAQLCAWP